VTGGDTVKFVFSLFEEAGFVSNKALYKITMDGVDCPVSEVAKISATKASVTCVSGERRGLKETTLELFIEGKGNICTRRKAFLYVSLWSSDTTWGGEFAPMEDESIHIPKGLNLLVDVDRTPKLMFLVVEGSLTFAPDPDPNHERYFDAHYVML